MQVTVFVAAFTSGINLLTVQLQVISLNFDEPAAEDFPHNRRCEDRGVPETTTVMAKGVTQVLSPKSSQKPGAKSAFSQIDSRNR